MDPVVHLELAQRLVKTMAPAVLRHRMVLQPEAEATGLTTDDALKSILDRVEVPR